MENKKNEMRSEYLKALPDGSESNNLSNLPSISKSELNTKVKS